MGLEYVPYIYHRFTIIDLGGGFKHVLFSSQKLGKIPMLTNFCFRWVETTNQFTIDLPRIYGTCNVGKYSSPMEHLGCMKHMKRCK